jgi:hypothetical protein
MQSRRRRHSSAALGAVALTTMASWVSLTGWPSAPASASVTATSHFIWTTTSALTVGEFAFINNGATNGLPGALLFVTPNDTPGGLCGCTDDRAPFGVAWSGFASKWAIIN